MTESAVGAAHASHARAAAALDKVLLAETARLNGRQDVKEARARLRALGTAGIRTEEVVEQSSPPFPSSTEVLNEDDLPRLINATQTAAEAGEPWAWYRLGRYLHLAGRLDDAEAAYLESVETDGGSLALHNLGIVRAERQDRPGAADAFRRALDLGSRESGFNYASILEDLGDLDEAESTYRKLTRQGEPRSFTALGRLVGLQGRYHEAEAIFREAEAQGIAGGASGLGHLLTTRARPGDDTRAIAAFERASDMGSTDADLILGGLALRQGDRARAQAAFRRADARGDARGTYNLGVEAARQGDWKNAERYARKSTETSDLAEASDLLGDALSKRGDSFAAVEAYRVASARGHAAAWYSIGREYLKQDNREAARRVFANGSRAGDPLSAAALAVILMDRGELERAGTLCRFAADHGVIPAMNNLGVVLLAEGEFQEALDTLARAAERGSAEAAFNLALALERAGDYDAARFAFTQAYRGGIVTAVNNLARVFARQGNLQAAETILTEAANAGDDQALVNLGVLRDSQELDSTIESILADTQPYAEPVDVEPDLPNLLGTEVALALV